MRRGRAYTSLESRTRRRSVGIVLALFLSLLSGLHAQNGATEDELSLYPVFIAPGAPRYTVTTRFNLARFDDGSYSGHVYRERSATLRDRSGDKLPAEYRGELYQYEQTLRNQVSVAKRVDKTQQVSVTLHGDGFYEAPESQALPRRRGFPVIPRELFPRNTGSGDDGGRVEPGDRWEAPGWMLVDPLWTGRYTRVDFYAGYSYGGVTEYYGREVHSITAQYALRYGPGDDPDGDPGLRGVIGSHKATILVDVRTAAVVLIRDRIDETYRFSDRNALRFEGFALTFVDTPTPLNRPRVADQLQRDLAAAQVEDVEVSSVDAGVQLRIGNINFKPDQAVILSDDYERLDALARTLQEVSTEKRFLVVGHTADIGNPTGQQRLSVARAKAVVDELTARGLASGRFIYEGRGGSEPIGDNSTPAGRARNRRVELTVLD